jgi:hypothetical protein
LAAELVVLAKVMVPALLVLKVPRVDRVLEV